MEIENKPKDIDQYIARAPEHVRSILQEMRSVIGAAAPGAVEVISYGMPAFKQKRILVYFAAMKNHIGFYPTASGIAAFSAELGAFKSSRGAVQFPNDRPIPWDLVARIVEFRAREDSEGK